MDADLRGEILVLLIEGARKEGRKEFSRGDQVEDGFLNWKIFYLYFNVFFICVYREIWVTDFNHPFRLGRYLNKWKLCDACVLSDLSGSLEEIDILDLVGTLYGGWVRAHYL